MDLGRTREPSAPPGRAALFALPVLVALGPGCACAPSAEADDAGTVTGMDARSTTDAGADVHALLDGDARRTDGSLDAGACHWDCFGGVTCSDGGVRELYLGAVPCERWTGSCGPGWPIDAGCSLGCREGAFGSSPTDVCVENLPREVGDPCTTDAGCEPAATEPDGFGGRSPVPLACDVPSGRCIRIEACDARDDDSDGVTDEGCAVRPRALANIATRGAVRDAAFGPDRIALLCATVLEPVLVIVDALGAPIATLDTGLVAAMSVLRVDGAFVIYRHSSSLSTSALTFMHDDGSRGDVELGGHPDVLFTRLFALDDGFLSVGRTDTNVVLAALWGPSGGAAEATTTLPSTSAAFRGTRGDPGAFLVERSRGPGRAWRVTRPLTVATLDALASHSYLSAPIRAGAQVVFAAQSADVNLVRVDAATGVIVSEAPVLEGTGTAMTLATAGPDLAASWLDGRWLRTIVVDPDDARVGATSLDVAASASTAVFGGETSGGVRIVVGNDTAWRLVAPAER